MINCKIQKQSIIMITYNCYILLLFPLSYSFLHELFPIIILLFYFWISLKKGYPYQQCFVFVKWSQQNICMEGTRVTNINSETLPRNKYEHWLSIKPQLHILESIPFTMNKLSHTELLAFKIWSLWQNLGLLHFVKRFFLSPLTD